MSPVPGIHTEGDDYVLCYHGRLAGSISGYQFYRLLIAVINPQVLRYLTKRYELSTNFPALNRPLSIGLTYKEAHNERLIISVFRRPRCEKRL
jgi:hypothetical protein